MDKTAVVEVKRTYRHPLYGKTVHRYSKFMAHDADNACQIGDEVILVESRPLSKHKRWVVQAILREDASARAVSLEEVAPAPGASGGQPAGEEDVDLPADSGSDETA